MSSTFSELHTKAQGLVQAGRLHEALAMYQDCLLRDAEFRAREGFHLQAVAVYREALRLDRSDAGRIFLAISRLHRQIGLPAWANQELRGAIAAFHKEGRIERVVEAFGELDPPELRPS